MERIVFLDRQSLKAEVRRPAFPHQWEEHEQTLAPVVEDRLAGATVAITNKVPIRRATLEKLPNLKLIAMAAIAGAEMAMLDCGIKVTPGSGVAAAGEYWRQNPAPSGLLSRGAGNHSKDTHGTDRLSRSAVVKG